MGSSALFQTGGNVGIGTMMPGAALDVMGNINASGSVQLQDTPVLQTPGGSMGGNLSVGPFALPSNTTGNNNTAVGAAALTSNTTGANDTAIGNDALANNTTGSNNIAIGENAAVNVTGSNSNNIHIGNAGLSSDNNTIRIGTFGTQASFYAAGVTAPLIPSSNIVGLQVDTTTGQLGIMMSSRRYKEDIQNMGDASRNLMRLRPVTFRYRIPSAHGSKPIQYGLIAEEVAEVYPELVAHSANGQIETVNYQVLDSMLLNEVQRQEKEIDDLRQQNLALQQRLSRLEAVIANSPALTSNQ
ncbi:MAG: tail fiber domain-containing protein [Acidobacteriia bacterium]|nr:tail fiber domain-containing protein [Terriglobia bacterium]